MKRLLLLVIALLLTAQNARAECVYLATSQVRDSFVVLDASDFSELFTVTDAGSLSFGLVVNGEYAYVNYSGFIDPSPLHLLLPGHIYKVDLVLKKVTGQFPTGRANFGLAYANGKLFTANAEDATVTIVDLARGSTKTLEGLGEFPTTVAATPDGSRVLVGDFASDRIYVIDTQLDKTLLSFPAAPVITSLLTTSDRLYAAGGLGLVAFQRNGDEYTQLWDAHLGYSTALAIAGQEIFATSRSGFLQSLLLEEPHDYSSHWVGSGRLNDIKEHGGWLYIASQEGLYRFSPADNAATLLYNNKGKGMRAVELAPCPRGTSTFPGDADCNQVLTDDDVRAAIKNVYDTAAQARCDADCNRDGQVSAADLTCTIRLR